MKKHPKGVQQRWEKVAVEVPGRSLQDVINHVRNPPFPSFVGVDVDLFLLKACSETRTLAWLAVVCDFKCACLAVSALCAFCVCVFL
eukprot:2077490-Rhodomonas_salina.2